MKHQDAPHRQSRNGPLEHPSAAAGDWNRLDESISLADELTERSEDGGITLPSDLVHDKNQTRVCSTDARGRLNKLCGR
ncbi:hypothetical protein D9M68_989480 [compost metagenome]